MMKTHQLYLNEGIKETFISCGRIPPIVLKISVVQSDVSVVHRPF